MDVMLDAMIVAGTVGTPYAMCWIVPIGGSVDEVAGASILSKKGIHVRVENKKVITVWSLWRSGNRMS